MSVNWLRSMDLSSFLNRLVILDSPHVGPRPISAVRDAISVGR
jgi:hypothetical protein